jgi:DNA primase
VTALEVTRELIAAVREKVQLIDLVAETTQLRRSGKYYRGICPFCSKHPTPHSGFALRHKHQVFRCSDCKAGGDSFSFIELTKNLDFIVLVSSNSLRT